MMPKNPQILILARYPVPGQAKTRLIPALGPGGAARLHRRMTERVAEIARCVDRGADARTPDITVCYTGAARSSFQAWLGSDLRYTAQPAGDLGRRLQTAFSRAFDQNSEHVIAVGTDIPDLTSDILRRAFASLQNHDAVLGPAADGGYYLIGMRLFHPELFESIDWGSGRVFRQTCDVLARLGLTRANLPLLGDVDRPEDLAALRRDARFEDVFSGNPMVSVMIPTLNEADVLGALLARLHLSVRPGADNVEIIVADGGSHDATCHIAARAGARVLQTGRPGHPPEGGRATQQNAAAAAARGRLLLFLHADTFPPDAYADLIRRALDCPATVAGAFRLRIDAAGKGLRLIEKVAWLRSRFLQRPYGDQGIFMEKRVFNEVGGFPPLPVMEDFALIQRLRQRGRIVTLDQAAITSARRWQRLGPVRTTLINQAMIAAFYCGAPASTLLRFYRKAPASLWKRDGLSAD